MHIFEDEDLASRCTLRVGGRARYLVVASNEEEVRSAVSWASDRNLPLHVLGGGSNLLIADGGVPGVVLCPKLRGIETAWDGDVLVTARAGEPWDEFVRFTVEHNLQGLECLSGIPGHVGATPIQNVGAYGQDVSQSIEQVRVLDRVTREIIDLRAQDCQFAYRDSFFKSVARDRYIVLAVSFRLREGGAPTVAYAELERQLHARKLTTPTLRGLRELVIELRRSKSMLLDERDPNGRSCGSFFVNPIVSDEQAKTLARIPGHETLPHFVQADGRIKLAAAWLIERAGFQRGTRVGTVGLSTRHALSIVCHDGARASDVASFAQSIQKRVFEQFAVELHPEPVFWGFTNDPARVAD